LNNFLKLIQDITDLTVPKTCQIEFPDKDDLLNFKLIIFPDEVILERQAIDLKISKILFF